MSTIQRIRITSCDSLNNKTPAIAAPVAPIPVQTAYAVPIGISFTDFDNKTKLATIATPVPIVGHNFVKPSVNFSPTAHPISNNPAMKRYIQANILYYPLIFHLNVSSSH